MNFLKNIFSKNEQPIKSNIDFWTWFTKHEKSFYNIVKSRKNLDVGFFDKIAPKLQELKEGYFYLTGMLDDNTVELVLTADGVIKNIVFVEELVSAAPILKGWKFTALKPALKIENVNISMGDLEFNQSNIFFYSNEDALYPDEIDITIVHNDFTNANQKALSTGVYLFLDNYLGELDFVNNVDSVKIIGRQEAEKELIPIEKLKPFLSWRQKEFIEKYEGLRYNTENDNHACFQGTLENGKALFATINTDILRWDCKASHPWIAIITIKYHETNGTGMPDEQDDELLDKIQEDLEHKLKDMDGYINIGRQTANSEREIYFACRDFRKPAKVFFEIQFNYPEKLVIDYEIYKDKYWQTFERFNGN